MSRLRIGVLVSGQGSNLRNLHGRGENVVAVATNRPSCGAAAFARERGLPLGEFPQSRYPGLEQRDAAMAGWLLEREVELVVCAGYDRVLSAGFVQTFEGRIINIHPSLLPAFAGGMDAVQRALEHGVKVSGCTVHLVVPEVDSGPILLQAAVPVLEGDDVSSLHARIQEQEHALLPEAVALMRERLGQEMRMQKRALLSVSDKAGLVEFATGLRELGFELYSTGGTRATLAGAGLPVSPVSDLTGFPEILDGRVKTLHPGVHAGILARRDQPEHLAALAGHGLRTIDLVCVNLYPFAATAARPEAGFEEILEQVDIGGPAMVRAAAKNHAAVVVVVRPERYGEVIEAIRTGGPGLALRRRLAAEAYAHTSAYDARVAAWLRSAALGEAEAGGPAEGEFFPAELSIAGELVRPMRYGENPHQRAAFYRLGPDAGGLATARQLQGVELSFNNVQDAAAAYALVSEYSRPAAAVVKHTNPCGLAEADTVAEAYARAYACDPVSAFGGVVAFNRPLDAATAEQLAAIFVEVVVAPEVTEEALGWLARKSRTRVLVASPPRPGSLDLRAVPGGFLVQTWDSAGFERTACRVVTEREPSGAEWEQLAFAWRAVKHVKSNAIVLARDFAAVGVGAGQMSRVEAARLAVARAGGRAEGAVMASDAFFPFPDGLEVGLAAGATAVIQPGGSVRDSEVIEAADRAGAAMVFTGQRHFKH